MKLRRVSVENVRSFLDRQELHIPGDLSIIIGPNGGGKTNLLDTAVLTLRTFLLKSWMPRYSPTPEWQDRYEWQNNDAINARLLERHSSGAGLPQIIELDLEVTKPDVENILRSKAEAAELERRAKLRYANTPGSSPDSWSMEGLTAGTVFSFRIVDGGLQSEQSPAAETFRRYLETFEVNRRVLEEYEQRPLSMPMMSLPVSRSSGDVQASISLANFDEYDLKRNVDAASSRASGSISSLAIGRLASRYRELLEKDDGSANKVFREDSTIESFTATLRSLGYDWELVCTNPLKNQYDIRLSKQGASFRVGAASSGERELLTYLFAVYALNVRDALIVIDEPELHLHPRWQRTLLALFERLAVETGNQFVMATHSPVFVSPASLPYVSRVYSENQRSRIVRLGDEALPERKHLFGIVNSLNNERVFFADLVILVEGISDRIFFEALFRHFKLGDGTGRVFEVVSVAGKMLFKQYERLLKACQVPFVLIADLDYVREVGTDAIKSLFSISGQTLKNDVIDNPASLDGASLLARMEEAVSSGSTADLKPLWEYVKSRQSRLRSGLEENEQSVLDKFISSQRKEGRFILSKGSLEAYLPIGLKHKDVEKLIALVAEPDFWDQLPEGGKAELQDIVHDLHL